MKQILGISHIIVAVLLLSSSVALPGQKDDRHKNPLSVVGAGNALSFDGVNDYVSIPHTSVAGLDSQMTIEAWIRPSSNGVSERIVDDITAGGSDGFLLDLVGGAPRIIVGSNAAGALSSLPSGNEWYHVAGTYDGSMLSIYVNGVLEDTTSASGPIPSNSFSVRIASDQSGGNEFSGVIDEVRIWNIALDSTHIRDNMHRTLAGTESGLIGYWQFNDGSGTIAHDLTGGSNDGTLVNFSFDSNDGWVTSTAPAGAGTSADTIGFASGTASLGSVVLTTTDAFDNPVQVVATQIPATPNSLPVGSSTVLDDRYWVINTFGTPGTFAASLTFSVPSSFTGNGSASATLYKLYSRSSTSDGSWTTAADTASGITPTTVTFDGITSFSQFVLGTDAILPIQIASLTATASENMVQLAWTTVSETNNYGFYVERRPKTGTTFTTVSDLIAGAGTSLQIHHYTWTDMNVGPTTDVYRLRQVDMNGHASYSNEIVVAGVTGVTDESAPKVFQLAQNYPNPFNPTTEIKFSVEKQEHATAKVYNILGVEVAQLFDGMAEPGHYYKFNFDGSRFGSGMYFYRIITDSHSAVRKMLMLK
jgi:hypothetical protein